MRILVISQYFWPENFRVNDLCIELKERGHHVSVLTGKPNYPSGIFMSGYSFFKKNNEIYKGIKVYRAPLIPRGNSSAIKLIINYLSFAFFACLKIFSINEKFDKIIVYQLSPATIGFPGILAKWRFRANLYFYIQDLWPESLVDAGGMNSKVIFNSVNLMMNLFYKRSTQIWVQSEGFVEFLLNKGVNSSKIKFLPNTVESFYKPEKVLNKYASFFPAGFNIVFAGNIGAAQDFDCILKASALLVNNNHHINWIIIGNGREKSAILEKIQNMNLGKYFHFIGSFPSNEMPYFFACADALLVSLKSSKIFSLTIPSKLQSYLACGKPIIGNLEGIAESIVLKSNSGLSSLSGDFVGLANNVEALSKLDIASRELLGVNAYNYYLDNFERNLVYNKLEQFLQ